MREGRQREGDNKKGCREHTVTNKEVAESEHWSAVQSYPFISASHTGGRPAMPPDIPKAGASGRLRCRLHAPSDSVCARLM